MPSDSLLPVSGAIVRLGHGVADGVGFSVVQLQVFADDLPVVQAMASDYRQRLDNRTGSSIPCPTAS